VVFTSVDASHILAPVLRRALVVESASRAGGMLRTAFPTGHTIALVTTGTLIVEDAVLVQRVTSTSRITLAFLLDAVIGFCTLMCENTNFWQSIANCWVAAQAIGAIAVW